MDRVMGDRAALMAGETMDDTSSDDQGELDRAVLEFLRGWPSRYPSPARIAQAVGRPPGAVIDALARLRARGDVPLVTEDEPSGPVAPSLDTWDRAN
jgi:hypothetical protein